MMEIACRELTADLPGTGGRVKEQPEDFRVVEIPAYDPCGEGEHLFVRIEKTGLSTEELVGDVASRLGIARREIGTAGLKDKWAVTEQTISIPAAHESQLAGIDAEAYRILSAQRHTNKLRTGHLRGNRFEIRIREALHPEHADAIVQRLQQTGLPNFFGSQRFGRDGRTAADGFALLSGAKLPRAFPPRRRRHLVKLTISAAQAALFNHVLAERMDRGFLERILAGDVARVVTSGGLFVVDDPDTDQTRFDAREIVPTGPMFGPKMRQAEGEVAIWEREVLESSGLSTEAFRSFGKVAAGTRRPLLVGIEELSVREEEGDVFLKFTLPPGTYATVLLQEITKTS